MEGQKLEDKQQQALETLPQDAPFMTKILVKHRRIIGMKNESRKIPKKIETNDNNNNRLIKIRTNNKLIKIRTINKS